MMRLKNTIAIVTGAASGMGRAHAERLAAEGAKVVLTDRDVSGGETSAKLICAAGDEAIFVAHDVGNAQSWSDVVEQCLREYGNPTVLVNNAGVYLVKPLIEMSIEDWNFVLDINLRGPFLGCRAIVPAMTAAGGGSIINVSSTFGIVAQRGFSAYCASKGGVRSFTKALAIELATSNIRVNSVHPGTIETAMTRPLMTDQAGIDALLGSQAIRRAGRAEEVASAVAFLASEDSSYMTGSEMVIDGGYVAG